MTGRAHLLAAALWVAVGGTAAAAGPAVYPGWPVAAPQGSVHVLPGRGATVIAQLPLAGTFAVGAFAFTPRGREIWRSVRTPSCGNCDGGQEPRLQADGTYGPLGPTGDDFWTVDANGRVVQPGCSGAVLADGTCIAHQSTIGPGGTRSSALRATRADATVWEFVEANLPWFPEDDVPPPVVRDGAGTVYVAMGDAARGSTTPERMLAVEGATGALRWRFPGLRPVAGLPAGVVAASETGSGGPRDGLTAVGADGTPLWTSPLAGAVTADGGTNAVYVQSGGSIVSLDATTGAERWRTAATETVNLLSVGTTGVVLAAVSRQGFTGLRAIGADGRGRWTYDTATPVVGARELPDGSVVLSAASGTESTTQGLLLRIDPRKRSGTIRTPRLSLAPTVIRSRCTLFADCSTATQEGATLRIALPQRARLRVRLVTANGTPAPDPATRAAIAAPRGTSYLRVLVGERAVARGRYLLVVQRTGSNPAVLARLPVELR